MKDSGNDSDFEPVLKPPALLDNKQHPTSSRIAMQKEIEVNKATKCSSITVFPDETLTSSKKNKTTEPAKETNKPSKPNMPSPRLLVPDPTNTAPTRELPEATQNVLPDKTEKDKNLPDVTKDVKPTKGVFKTTQISIRRSKDPRTFKCSACDTRTSSLKELNAHFIKNHHQVNCDICSKGFNTPRSLRKHQYSHVEEESQFKCGSCDKMFPFESQLKSH